MNRASKYIAHLQPQETVSLVPSPTAEAQKTPAPYAYRDDVEITPEAPRKTSVLKGLVGMGLLDSINAIECFDLDLFEAHCKAVLAAPFPPNTLHTVACKAQPTAKILALASTFGLGCETASLPELIHSTRCGFPAANIIFDSPSKSLTDIQGALKTGVWLNADNFMELEVIDGVLKSLAPVAERRRLGIRINVQTSKVVGSSITSTPTSKFGVGMLDDRQAIIDNYVRFPWLNAIHCHCGSQGVDVDFLVGGARDVMNLVNDVNKARNGSNPVTHIDIGGGLETDYLGDKTIARFSEYATKLKVRVPELWSGKFVLATEFGRALCAKSAFAVSRVEYTKITGGRPIATTHVGADYHVRAAYHPHLWMPKVSVYGPTAVFKDGSAGKRVSDIAGPLCFSGDLLVKGVMLPNVETRDYVMVHDTGAYTMGMWSRYNSRQAPPSIGFRTVAPGTSPRGTVTGLLSGSSTLVKDGLEFCLIKRGETVDDVLRFWQ